MTERTPEEIAVGLTAGQRQVIRAFGHAELLAGTVELGLVTAIPNPDPRENAPFWTLTPLGLAVKSLIEKDSRRGG